MPAGEVRVFWASPGYSHCCFTAHRHIDDTIGPDDLPQHIVSGNPVGSRPLLPQEQTLAEVEKAHILHTLERFGWNHSRAAEALDIGRTSLWRKLKEYQIEDRSS